MIAGLTSTNDRLARSVRVAGWRKAHATGYGPPAARSASTADPRCCSSGDGTAVPGTTLAGERAWGMTADRICLANDCTEPRVVYASGRLATFCRAHLREYARRHRALHPEVAAKAQRRYSEAHADRLRDYRRERSQAFRDARPSYVREWHRTHADEEREKRAEHRQANLTETRVRDRDDARERRAAHPGEHARQIRQWMYHLPPGAIEAMYARQEGRCAICGEERPMDGRGGLHVDHDHATGEVRGLLCGNCNASLVALERVGADWPERAFAYLREPPYRRLDGGSQARQRRGSMVP